MSYINFEDHALIKKQWVGEKMNAMGEMFKYKKNGVTIKSGFFVSCWKL